MSEELKQAAQQALDALKKKHGHWGQGHDKLNADAIAALERALTQRPAAQAGEREAFEAWARPHGYDLRRNAVLGHYSSIDTLRAWDGWQARASLPTQPAAQATPEPVGEVFGWLFQHEETGLVQVVDSQQVEWGFEANNPRWQKIRPVYTRPAPGVPEGFALLDGLAAKGGLHGVDLQYRRPGSCGWPNAWRATLISTPAIAKSPCVGFGDTPQDALAAAQAKGADK